MISTILPSKEEENKGSSSSDYGGIGRANKKYYYIGVNRMTSSVEEEIIEKDIIVVDSREFSSMTPVYLHEKGFWLIPMVLTVGDYVLSDDICIERKSVLTGDLFESFRSGRLLQ
jgi:ERCC4-type nuclease